MAVLEEGANTSRLVTLSVGPGNGCTQVGDASLAHLKGLNNLKTLNLWNTGITDAGLENLKHLPNLESLTVSRTQVSDEAVRKLRQAWPRWKVDVL